MDIEESFKEKENDLAWRTKISEKDYDVVIFGGGPCGLTLAQCASRVGKKVLIVEKEDTLGGCHRVEWYREKRKETKEELWFTEHGPRVYISNFYTFRSLLEDMGYDYQNLFQSIDLYDKFRKQDGMTEFSLSFRELMHLTGAFFTHIFMSSISPYLHNHTLSPQSKNTTVQSFMDDHRFSRDSQWYLDTICRLTDGGGAKRYSMFQLMDFFDISMTKQLMQPKVPNDHPNKGFVYLWQKYLEKQGVDILTGWKIETFDIDNRVDENDKVDEIESALIQNMDVKNPQKNKVRGKHYVLAMPPEAIRFILSNNNNEGLNLIRNAFGPYESFEKYCQNTRYDDYICFSLHWINKDKIAQVQKKENKRTQTPYTPWGIFAMHMNFAEWNPEIFIMSCCMTRTDTQSPVLHKNIHQCDTVDEWLTEGTRQTREAFTLPEPDMKAPFEDIIRKNGKWYNNTTGFFHASGEKSLEFQSPLLHNLFQVGTQNGKHKYNVTTIESAVSNSIALAHVLYPETRNYYKIFGPGLRIRHVIFIAIVFIVLFAIIFISILVQ